MFKLNAMVNFKNKGFLEHPSALVFFSWTATDKPEFTDWSEVQQRFGSGEIAIFRQRMIIN